MARLLYIMGTGRSGTTILDVLLSAGEEVFGAGELTYIFRDGLVGNKKCSCGQLALECPFWDQVRKLSGLNPADLEAGEEINRSLEKHGRFPLAALGLVASGRLELYRRLNSRILTAVAAVAGAKVVVDSSKYAGRALLLSRFVSKDAKIILLTREPAGLIAAFRKSNKEEQRPKSALAVLVYYFYSLTCFRWVQLRRPDRVLTVSYERLMAEPVSELERIQVWAGIDLGEAIERLRAGRPFAVRHMVTGNRLRHQGEVVFTPSSGAKVNLGRGLGLLVRILRGYRSLLGLESSGGRTA